MLRLSASQEELLDAVSSRWIRNALGDKAFDMPLIEGFLEWLYRCYALGRPEIHYAQSPLSSQQIAAEIRALRKGWET